MYESSFTQGERVDNKRGCRPVSMTNKILVHSSIDSPDASQRQRETGDVLGKGRARAQWGTSTQYKHLRNTSTEKNQPSPNQESFFLCNYFIIFIFLQKDDCTSRLGHLRAAGSSVIIINYFIAQLFTFLRGLYIYIKKEA